MSKYIIKKSVGVILYDKMGKNVLMVQKRTSYAFTDFIMGRYNKNNRRNILSKFNNMTIHEKILVRSLNFDLMWYHHTLNLDKTPLYYRCLTKFTNNFLVNNNKLLKGLLNGSIRNVDLLWEPPKGRINDKESNLSCAMRELKEETGITSESYQIIKGHKVKKAHMADKIKYVVYYYIAKCREDVIPTFSVSNTVQAIELANTKWIPVRDIKGYNMINDIRQAIISKYVKINSSRGDLSHSTVIDVLN